MLGEFYEGFRCKAALDFLFWICYGVEWRDGENMSFLRFLGLSSIPSPSGADTDAVRKITEALDKMEPERAKFIAAFAYLLGRVARADLNISSDEVRSMERIVMERAGLSEEQAIIVIQIAKTQNILFGATENFLVAREFNNIAQMEDKLSLLRCLFAVAAADGSISAIEDNEIRQIADELRIEHRDFIEARSQFRNFLAVLKKPPMLE
jgi:uncharacterized tellurite resistance protein B-like protein